MNKVAATCKGLRERMGALAQHEHDFLIGELYGMMQQAMKKDFLLFGLKKLFIDFDE